MENIAKEKQEDVKKIAKKIGKQLKTIMLQRDMKQMEVAEIYGTSKSAFNNLMNQKLNKISDILKISQILDCNVKLSFFDNTGKEWVCDFVSADSGQENNAI